MSTSITHEDIKPRMSLGVTLTAGDDTLLDTICTGVAAGVDGAAAAAPTALLKEAAITIASGEGWLSLCNRPGFAEAITAAGVAMGALTKDGAVELIKLGWSMLTSYMGAGAAAEAAENAARVLLAQARDDDAGAQADAELLKLQNDAAIAGSQKVKLDVEKSLLDKEVLTETEKPAKVVADTALASAYAAQATAVAALKAAEKTRLDAVDVAIATDLPQASSDFDGTFAVDSSEYMF